MFLICVLQIFYCYPLKLTFLSNNEAAVAPGNAIDEVHKSGEQQGLYI